MPYQEQKPGNFSPNDPNLSGSSRMGQAQENETVEIDLGRIFRAVWKHFWMVILGILIGALLALLITVFLIKPKYRTSFTVYVNNHSQTDTTSVTSDDTRASQALACTYAAIIQGRSVLKDVAEEAGLNYDYEQLSEFVSTSVESSTQLVTVYVTMTSQEESYDLANAILDTAPGYIANIVEGSSLKAVSEPEYPEKPYSPSRSKNTVIGALLGALVMITIIIVKELTDTRIKSADQLEERYGLSVIGTIPDFEKASSEGEYGRKGRMGHYGYY